MPLKLSIKLGENLFAAEGDFTFDTELTSLFRVWVAALGGQDGVTIEQIAEQQEQTNLDLTDAVTAHTPGVTP